MTVPVTETAKTRHPKNRVVGATAAIAATGALACSVCCVLPFALPAAILATSGGVLAWLGSATPWVTTIAVVAVTGAWMWVGIQSVRAMRRPALSTLRTMAAASAMLVAALAWPHFEESIVGLLRR
jgi:hypothetical protein